MVLVTVFAILRELLGLQTLLIAAVRRIQSIATAAIHVWSETDYVAKVSVVHTEAVVGCVPPGPRGFVCVVAKTIAFHEASLRYKTAQMK